MSKINKLLSGIYSIRHVIAIGSMLLGICLIKKITILFYFSSVKQQFTLFSLCHYLWLSNDLFLRFILIINFIIKPVFIYFGIILCFYYFNEKFQLKSKV
ncbi:hypothetical protein [Legionella quateirensis]|uniref:hypothetical protein n=1 Tax=Legionella quateirensis TaxID=45072 RepID=UPI0007304D1D|nr:hypothetical protein [Legionella quateirensis]